MKTLLIALPWAEHEFPSVPIGYLSAFVKRQGFSTDALHLHLEVAAEMGFDVCDACFHSEHMLGEALSAALLFPNRKNRFMDYAERHQAGSRKLLQRYKVIMRKLYDRIEWSDYDVVAFAVYRSQLFSSLLMARWIKSDNPEIRTVMTGRLASGDLGSAIVRCFPQVDWCIDGEPEIPLTGLIRRLGRKDEHFEQDIPGLIYRDGGYIHRNPRTQQIDLCGIPDPDYDHYFKTLYENPALEEVALPVSVPVEAGRGCNYDCAFCGDHVHYDGYRCRPAVEIRDSLDRMCLRHRVPSVLLVEQMLTKDDCDKLFPQIAALNRDYSIFCEIRAGFPRETLRTMKAAGVSEVQIGLEALDTGLLRKMQKRTRLIDNLETMKFIEELGIAHRSNLIVGFPSATQSEVDRSVRAMDLACAYMPPLYLEKFELVEDSPAYRRPSSFGISRIRENMGFLRMLPKDISRNMRLYHKQYTNLKPRCNYLLFRRRHELWKERYAQSQITGTPLLQCLDCGDFLRIEDAREEAQSLTLDGWMRQLYLFCRSIRSVDDIKESLPDVTIGNIMRMLKYLCKLGFMFGEGGEYLSLAPIYENEMRARTQFL
jgi:ribosomal peptide maturation radical SAM protein 1